jgi:hypothetical protein
MAEFPSIPTERKFFLLQYGGWFSRPTIYRYEIARPRTGHGHLFSFSVPSMYPLSHVSVPVPYLCFLTPHESIRGFTTLFTLSQKMPTLHSGRRTKWVAMDFYFVVLYPE